MRKSFYLIIFLFIAFFLAGCTLVRILNYKINEPQALFNFPINEEEIIRRKIDGAVLSSNDNANLYPVAIMVENAADSWPQSGLDKANLVIEAPTESSIPRFVAIYATNEKIEKIGPVRSARPYYLDWIDPFKSLYMHVGGSPAALQEIKSEDYNLVDLNQFFNGQYYWRDKWRYAPHNVYTSSDLIKQALADKKLTVPANYETWQYKADLEAEKRPAQVNDLVINFGGDYYQVKWKYNKADNDYIRYQAGEIQKMSDGEWLKAKNVIVQVNDAAVIDEVGREKIKTVGEGKAWIFRDGETISGKWKKDGLDKITKYYDSNNKEIEFNGGTTWIEVIPNEDLLRS